MKNLSAIALLLLLFWAFRKFKAAKDLNFEIVGVRTIGDLLSAKIILETNVNNPTETPVYIDYIVADVLLSGKKVGKIEFRQKTLLQPGINKIEIPVILAPLVTAGVIFDIIAEKNTFTAITLNGVISFEGVQTSIIQKYPLLQNA